MSTASPPSPSPPPQHQKEKGQQKQEESAAYLRSLLNKNLRITTTDNRMFWGAFKCTDPDSNIVLQHTYEYRHPTLTAQQVSDAVAAAKAEADAEAEAAAAAVATEQTTGAGGEGREDEGLGKGKDKGKGKGKGKGNGPKVKLDMTSRYLGLVVVPGKYIVRIEVEEFLSQMRGRQVNVLGVKEQGIGAGMVGGVGVS